MFGTTALFVNIKSSCCIFWWSAYCISLTTWQKVAITVFLSMPLKFECLTECLTLRRNLLQNCSEISRSLKEEYFIIILSQLSAFYFIIVCCCFMLLGSFKNSEMSDWFIAGYFPMTLQIRRGPTGPFTSLGLYFVHSVFDFLYYIVSGGTLNPTHSLTGWCLHILVVSFAVASPTICVCKCSSCMPSANAFVQ